MKYSVLVFTGLYNHHHCLITECFHHPQKETLYSLAVTSHSLFPLPLETTNLIPVSVDLPLLDVSHKWNLTIYDLFFLLRYY